MAIWTAIRRLNRRYDEWQARAAARFVAKLDHPGDNANNRPAIRDRPSSDRESAAGKAGK